MKINPSSFYSLIKSIKIKKCKKNRCSLSYRAAPLPTRTTGVGTVGDACLDEFLVALLSGAKQLGRRFLLFENDTTINPQKRYKHLERKKQRFANRQGL